MATRDPVLNQQERLPRVRFSFQAPEDPFPPVVPAKAGSVQDFSIAECLIRPMVSLRDPLWGFSTLEEEWNEAARGQYRVRLKELEADREPARSRCLRVGFSSGSQCIALFIEPSISNFELHVALRQAFGEACKGKQVRLTMSGLGPRLASDALHGFALLAYTIAWKPTEFGRRLGQLELEPKMAKGAKAKVRRGGANRSAPAPKVSTTDVRVLAPEIDREEAEQRVARASSLAEANNLVRTLADLPANELDPKRYRRHVEAVSRASNLRTEFLDYRRLLKEGAGAFLAVARAEAEATDAGILKIRYPGRGPAKSSGSAKSGAQRARRRRVALVGKGICFDTGGYNLKPGSYMLGMHGDMTGSAIAFALCRHLAEMGVDYEVTAYLALAQNLISPTAYKPNEVVVACDGTSIEVVDTDAEGRMILADTLALARRDQPDLIIDFATLTGAAIRALDTRRAAVFSNRPELATLAVQAGELSGERTWAFPIGDDYRTELKSKIADLLQCGPSNNADHIYAATFLAHFVGEESRWVHLDLVPAANKGGLGLIASETTGFGVLWADQFLQSALATL